MGLYHVVLSTEQNSLKKTSMTIVEMKQTLKNEKIDPESNFPA